MSLIFRLNAETVIVTTTDSAFVPGNNAKTVVCATTNIIVIAY
ncbi:hypothetical protein [Nostoc sp.]